MNYEINVSLKGQHLFATAERSITSQYELDRIAPIILKKFPPAEGFEVSCVRWNKVGERVKL